MDMSLNKLWELVMDREALSLSYKDILYNMVNTV